MNNMIKWFYIDIKPKQTYIIGPNIFNLALPSIILNSIEYRTTTV
jgi:hypothetical protein